jgi:hypothetical protein
MMTTTQTFPFGGSYESGLTPMTTRGSYAGSSGTAHANAVSGNVRRFRVEAETNPRGGHARPRQGPAPS